MLLAVELQLRGLLAHAWATSTGQVFVFFILTVAAAEAAIGLAILVVLFRSGAASTSPTSVRSRADAWP